MLLDWLNDAWSVIETEGEWDGWELIIKQADHQNSFNARDVVSLVVETRGPVLVLGRLQNSAVARLVERLGLRVIVTHCADIGDSTDVYAAVREALERHMNGDPQVSRRLAVALMLVRKLLRGCYWGGGAKAKSYLSVEELAKGRGVDEQYSDIAPEVANMLEMKGLLTKKKGDGHMKYALNTKRREEIDQFMRSWRVADDGLHKYLYGCRSSVSARVLDQFDLEADDGEGALSE